MVYLKGSKSILETNGRQIKAYNDSIQRTLPPPAGVGKAADFGCYKKIKKIMKISEIQNQIKVSISQCLLDKGFSVDKSPTFYNFKNNSIRIVHINFLDKKSAAYFNSNTASFNLNLCINFNFENQTDFYPKEYESHIRGCLIKDFSQKNPMNLKGFSLFHPEKRRRDIWWVENDASNLEYLLVNASRIINSNAVKWLDTFSDTEFIIRYLKRKNEIDSWKGGPFGFGSIGSPCRLELIEQLENKTR